MEFSHERFYESRLDQNLITRLHHIFKLCLFDTRQNGGAVSHTLSFLTKPADQKNGARLKDCLTEKNSRHNRIAWIMPKEVRFLFPDLPLCDGFSLRHFNDLIDEKKRGPVRDGLNSQIQSLGLLPEGLLIVLPESSG